MINISSLECCVSGGLLTSSRYSSELDMVVNSVPTPYLTVCAGFCPNGYVNGKCGNTATYKEVLDFKKCISLIEPATCTGASMPVAYSGATLYYGSSAGDVGCTQTETCQGGI